MGRRLKGNRIYDDNRKWERKGGNNVRMNVSDGRVKNDFEWDCLVFWKKDWGMEKKRRMKKKEVERRF